MLRFYGNRRAIFLAATARSKVHSFSRPAFRRGPLPNSMPPPDSSSARTPCGCPVLRLVQNRNADETCGRNLSVEGLIDHIKKAVNLQAGLERRSSGLTRFLGLIEADEAHSAERDCASQ